MFVLRTMAPEIAGDRGMRPLLFILLLLAILLLLTGAVIAVVTLRNQRKNASGVLPLKHVKHEGS